MKYDNLHERLECLEKQNKRLQKALMVLAAGLVALLVMGAKAGLQDGHFGKITAERINIVDGQGNEIIQIGTDESAGTGIRILDKNGTRLVAFGITADEAGSGMLIADKTGRPRLGLGIDEDVPSLAVLDENGKKIVALGGDKRGYGLVIMDGNEVERAGIGYKEGDTVIVLYDDKGQYVRGMFREKGGAHHSTYLDGNGNEIFMK